MPVTCATQNRRRERDGPDPRRAVGPFRPGNHPSRFRRGQRPDETIETEVTLVTHGTPIGISEGGRLELLAHSLTIKCRANAIPDVIRMEVGELHLNQGFHVRDLTLPEGVSAATDADVLLAHVTTLRGRRA